MSPVLFISSVSAEFGELRRRIARLLERTKRVRVRHQDDFFNRGLPTLRMLEEEVRSSTAVLHLIGEQSGWTPPPDQVQSFLHRNPEFLHRFPRLASQDLLISMSATQWEAWLALFFAVDRVACFLLSPADHDMRLQQSHVEMLINYHTYPTIVPSRAQLFDEVFGFFVENRYLDSHSNPQPPHSTRTTPTIGQHNDVQSVKEFLCFSDTVIIWGPGGSGKTTLARSLAADYQGRKIPVLWVELLRVTSLDGIYCEILKSIDSVLLFDGRSHSVTTPLSERIAIALRQLGSALLILDNAEHLGDAIIAAVNTIRTCALPNLSTVITSQYNFSSSIKNTLCIPITPLNYAKPDQPSEWNLESVAQMDATKLFVDKARGRIRHLNSTNWEPIARICNALQGHPLSISLAAGQLASRASLTVDDLVGIVQRNPAHTTASSLSDDFEYKTTSLAASVRWSLSLCSEAEQQLLYAVAYLTDGFTEDCANRIAICILNQGGQTIRSTTHLCDASLLQPNPHGRYRLIESVRTQIEESANLNGDHHLERCIDALSEEISLLGCDGVFEPTHENLTALESERGNVRRLVARALAGSNPTLQMKGLILLSEYMPALYRIEMPHSVVGTYEVYLQKAHLLPLPLACRLVRFIARAKWGIGQWNEAAHIIHNLVETNRASFRLINSADIEWDWGDRCELSLLLADRVRLGCLASRQGDQVARQMTFEDLMVMINDARELSPPEYSPPSESDLPRRRTAVVRASLAERQAQVLDSRGDYSSAIECVKQIVSDQLTWSLLSTQQQGEVQNRLGLAYWHNGQLDAAEECFRHASGLFSRAGDTLWQAGALTNLSFVLIDLEMFAASIQCCQTAEGLHKAVGNTVWEAINLGAWGNSLAWSGEYKDGLARLEQGLSLVKATDPDTRAQFSGDLARVLLFLDTTSTVARAELLLEQAIAFQAQTGRPTRRLFGNTVLLAHARSRLARPLLDIQTLAAQARQMATELRLTLKSPVLQVRRDLTLLEELETCRLKPNDDRS